MSYYKPEEHGWVRVSGRPGYDGDYGRYCVISYTRTLDTGVVQLIDVWESGHGMLLESEVEW